MLTESGAEWHHKAVVADVCQYVKPGLCVFSFRHMPDLLNVLQ